MEKVKLQCERKKIKQNFTIQLTDLQFQQKENVVSLIFTWRIFHV